MAIGPSLKARAGWAMRFLWASTSWALFSQMAKSQGVILGGIPVVLYVVICMAALFYWAQFAFEKDQSFVTRLARSFCYALVCAIFPAGLMLIYVLWYSQNWSFSEGVRAVLIIEAIKTCILGVGVPVLYALTLKTMRLNKADVRAKGQLLLAQVVGCRRNTPLIILIFTVVASVATFLYAIIPHDQEGVNQPPSALSSFSPPAGKPSWSEVTNMKAFHEAPRHIKMELRDAYFKKVIAPNVPQDRLSEYWQQFHSESQSTIDGR